MKTTILLLTILTISTLHAQFDNSSRLGFNQYYSSTGLEVSNYKELPLYVTSLESDGKKIGLTEDIIKTKCELKCRSFNIKPLNETTVPGHYELLVHVTVVGYAFGVSLEFERAVHYKIDEKDVYARATLWSKTRIGTHGGKRGFILETLAIALDEFLNDYLKANQN